MAINIAELWEKSKYWIFYGGYTEEAYELIILLGVAFGAFACGRLSIIEERSMPVSISRVAIQEQEVTSSSTKDTEEPEQGRANPASPGSVVASKHSDKYHLPWCGGAQTIKEENKVWFASEEEAVTAGYTKAGNCK